MRRLILLAVAAAVLVASGVGDAQPAFPEVIGLPDGFQPEGIAAGRGTSFYVGSIPTGAVYRGDLRTGRGAILVPGRSGRAAIGMDVDARNRLFVAGGSTGKAFVYSAASGRLLRSYRLAPGAAPAFVNDVIVTRSAAWFTDSSRHVLYRLSIAPNGRLGGSAAAVRLSGDFRPTAGLNLNGIEATANGKTLIVVQSSTGKLFTVQPGTGATSEIEVDGGPLSNGDGMLLDGRTLYVVQNQLNRIAVVRLAPDLSSGKITRRLTDPRLDVPTTIARHGKRLYAVNARFGTPPGPSTAYQVVQVKP